MVEHVNQQLISSAVFALQEEWENFAKVGCSEQIFRLYVKMGQLNHRHVLLKSCFSFTRRLASKYRTSIHPV